MRRFARIAAAACLAVGLALPAYAQISPDDIADAQAELDELRSELDAMTARYFDALAHRAELDDQAAYLMQLTEDAQIDLARTRDGVRERAADMYMEAIAGSVTSFALSPSPVELGARFGYLDELAKENQVLLRDLAAARVEYDRQLGELREVQRQQEVVVVELEALKTDLGRRLEDAQTRHAALVRQFEEQERRRREEEERRRREEEERRRQEEAARLATSTTSTDEPTNPDETTITTAPEAVTTSTEAVTTSTEAAQPAIGQGGMYCPVNGFTTFSDTWGAARSGGRRHEGVDMLAARGTPVVAVEDGIATRLRSGGLGGISVWLRGTSGDVYYYAHLDSWTPGLSEGLSVSGGQELGYVGSSGNAPDWLPHLHFEFHPGGGRAANPTPLADSLCR